MKFKYIQPTAKVVNINISSILADSGYIPNQEEKTGGKALSERDIEIEYGYEEEYY